MKSLKMTLAAFTLALTGVIAPATSAQAREPLRDVPEIDQSMLWVAIANEVGKRCDTLDRRMAKGFLVLYQLRDKALSMGYTPEEIEAYVTSDEEKARMRKLGEAYAKSNGLNPDDTADLCKLGEIEIARNSQIGVLLREK